MNAAPAMAMVAVVLLSAAPARAAPPEAGAAQKPLAAAQKRLDQARENLAKALARIEKDPPSTPDLDAAHAAVEALRDVVNEGAEFEAKDLEYAKAALAARKDLRTQGEYVEQRRANVHIHQHRRVIDEARAKLEEAAKRTESKDAGSKQFDEARAAAAQLRKVADEGRPFAKQDPKFGAYLSEVDAQVKRTQDALDDRWTQRAVDTHRGLLEESRKNLTSAMGALEKDAGDAKFEAADQAVNDLSKRLEDGRVFEPRDKAYRADADKARTELSSAKRRMAELLTAATLDRLKAEIEPANKELLLALKGLRGKRPTEEQLALARTASIVVRKLVEKFQPQAQRSPAFGQYVAEVKKTLVEVEVELQRRSLDAARADAGQALRNVERRSAEDSHFEELQTALTVLEKTLESVHARDPALVKPVADAKTFLRDARATAAKRRVEVDIQRQRAKVQETRKATEAAVRQLQQADVGPEQLAEADQGIQKLQAVLEEGKPLTKKDRDYGQFDKDTRQRVTELQERIAARKLALAAGGARGELTQALTEARTRLDTARKPTSTDADQDAAAKGTEALVQVLEKNAGLEAQDKGYAGHAERARGEVARLMENVELARQARELRKQTGEALAAGTEAAEAAAGTQDLRKQKEHYERAIARFTSCEKDGAERLKENPALSRTVVPVEGREGSPKEVMALCAERAKAADPQLRQVLALLAFEDGPKRSYESAKALLGQDKKGEALPKFADCISSGRFALYKFPELKERKFPVAGASMTITEVIDQCIGHRKSLAAK